jgi:hypothetical protein
MVGHGSPSSASAHAPPIWLAARLAVRLFRKPAHLLQFCLTILIAAVGVGQLRAADGDPTVHVRVAWGSTDRPHQWQGTITASRGTLTMARPLGIEADEPGSMWDADGGVRIRQRSVRWNDGIDIDVCAPLDAVLTVELRDMADPNAAASVTEAPLNEIIAKPFNKELDKGSRLLLRRVPGDLLRVAPRRDNLVFSPGDDFEFDVEPTLLPVSAGTSLQLKARLVSAGKEWSAQEQIFKSGDKPRVPFAFKIPPNEGVYDLLLAAYEPPALRFNKAKLVAERRIQIVVIAAQSPEPAAEPAANWSHVDIDPANPRWYERFKALSILPSLSQGTISNGEMQTLAHPLGTLMKLGPSAPGQEPQWQAYPLTVSRTGAPHIVEVEYPSDVPQTLGISVVEPNAAGLVLPIGLDSGVYVEEELSPTSSRMLKHRVLFWPHTKNPVLLISNRRDGAKAVFGKIHVLSGPASLPRAPFVGAYAPERLFASYMSRPLVAENFGAPEVLDTWSGRSLKDWQTFYDGALRLTEYLNHVGHGGQMLTVMADGSTIYPSAVVEPTSLFDNGMFFDLGQDPMRKDVLELSFRMFDRAGLKLIPALQFVAPLPELEARLRKGENDAIGIELIGPEGKSYIEANSTRRGVGPYYNPLNKHVQAAMLAVIRELLARYQQHSSFGGLSIELTADGFAQLPGIAWALDDETIAEFQRDTKIQVPGLGPTRFTERADFLIDAQHENNPQRQAWLEWRANKLAEFYRSIQKELVAARRDAVLYLSPTNLFDGPDAKALLRPALPPAAMSDDVLLTMGIRVEQFRGDRGLVLLRPYHVSPPGSLTAQAADIELNRPGELDAQLKSFSSAGALLFHEPQKTRLASFDAKNPFGKDKSTMYLVSQMSPSGRGNRQRFVHAIAATDPEVMFDGGWLLPLGQEDSLTDLIAAYRRLPAAKFKPAADSVRPVTIRTLSTFNSTYAYLVNDSPCPTMAKLQLDVPPGCRIEELSGRRRLPPLAGSSWSVPLDAYDFVAVRFWARDVRVLQSEIELDQNLKSTLSQRVHNLQTRLTALVDPPELPRLLNSDFEQPAKPGQIPGWSLSNGNGGTLSIDPEGKPVPQKPVGKQAARLECNGQFASLCSDPFAPPTTGRLSISMWLRVEDAQQQPKLLLAIKSRHENKEYYRFAPVGQGASNIGETWGQFIMPIDDLPGANLDKLQVRFDLIGAGKVWIDDVQLRDLKFTPKEQFQLSKLVAFADLQLTKGKLGDCLDQLDSYWLRFLATYVPLNQQQFVQGAPGAQPQAAPAPAAQAPGKSATKPSGPFKEWMEKLR